MKRRVLSLLLVLSMTLTLLPIQASAVDTANPFRDVSEGDWYYDAAQYVRVNGFFEGTTKTTFSPNATLTRCMFVTVLGRMVQADTKQYEGRSVFSDVPEDAYFAPYVAWASKYGITTGTGNGKFSPYAPIDRQQMATFFVRYFEAFGVEYETGNNVTTDPADIDSVDSYARDAVLKLWRQGLLNGDGVNFNPGSSATRAEAATICYRMDRVVEVWYKEAGVASERVKIDPATGEPYVKQPDKPTETDLSGGGYYGGSSGGVYSVSFYDGTRLIEAFNVRKGQALRKLPSVAKSSKAGATLEGYYTNPGFTTPFYAEDPVTRNMRVYAKYEDLEEQEDVLTFTAFTRMDQSPDLSYQIRRLSGDVESESAAALAVKDGSDPVEINVKPVGGSDEAGGETGDKIYKVYAPGGFNEGCSYELTLAEGWIFVDEDTGEDKPESIRTASFSIAMADVWNLKMSEAVKFIQDTNDSGSGDLRFTINGKTYETLTNSAVNDMANGNGTFDYSGDVSAGDIVCVYVGVRPDERRSGNETKDPAAYVKVTEVSGGEVTFAALGADDQKDLYEIPDNFPFLVETLPAPAGEISIDELDTALYAVAAGLVGRTDGELLAHAKSRLNAGDFVTFYNGLNASGEPVNLFFGRVTQASGDGAIVYKASSEEELLHSMDLYDQIETEGSDYLEEDQRAELEDQLQQTIAQSGFAAEAAYLLADMVTKTNTFQENPVIQKYAASGARIGALSGSFSLTNSPTVRVQLNSKGSHFNGVQMKVTVSAKLQVPLGNDVEAFVSGDYLTINLEGSFDEEVTLVPSVKGQMLYERVLGIPIPKGVRVNANLDVKNFTAFAFDADICTTDAKGVVEEELGHVSSLLEDMKNTPTEEEYLKSMETLMERYQEMVGRDPGWITLVEKRMFNSENCYYGVCFGVEGTFVVRADLSLAIGSSMEYQVGKRYIFWFEAGLFKPTSGSSTMDLMDERFAFQFYVMGRLSIRAGVRFKVYVGIGTGDFVSVGLTAETGPYISLYGFFIYSYNKYRPQGSSLTNVTERKEGALGMELGLYVSLGYEAKALIFTHSDEFRDKTFPLLHAGVQEVYYGCAYRAEPDEAVYITNESGSPDVVVMTIPESLLEMNYMSLVDGRLGSRALTLDNYNFSVSNRNFSLEKADDRTLKVYVNVPATVSLMRCDLTVTYKGKFPFSVYDMTTTIPLVWTNLSERLLKEYYTATVRVGNKDDGYDTVWRQKVVWGEEFDLPGDAEVKALARWNDLRYEEGAGYGSQSTISLGIIQDTVFDYDARLKTYKVTVTGIQNEDGTTGSRTFEARYGEAFNFSDLEKTGTSDYRSGTFTRFCGIDPLSMPAVTVGTDDNGAPIRETLDVTQPINQRMAEALSGGNVTVEAQYVDDSVTAVFSFTGIDHEDVLVTGRRGDAPDTTTVYDAVAEEAEKLGLKNLAIVEITPKLGPISDAAHYTVRCVALSGERVDVTLDYNYGNGQSPNPDHAEKLVGSVLAVSSIPSPERTGYTFRGWAYEEENGDILYGLTVPEREITLYAQWEANTYTIYLKGQGGDINFGEDDNGAYGKKLTVTYDSTYELPQWLKGDQLELTGQLEYEGMRFFGWWTEPGGDGEEWNPTGPVDFSEDVTLYACWKPRIKLSDYGDLFTVTPLGNKTYDRNTYYRVGNIPCKYIGGTDNEGTLFPVSDSFTIELLSNTGGAPSGEVIAHDADSYHLRITRKADLWYDGYTRTYYNVLVINKANWKTAIWDKGLVSVKVQSNLHSTASDELWVRKPEGTFDLPDSIVNGMRWNAETSNHRFGSGHSKKDAAYLFTDTYYNSGMSSDGNDKATIWLVFTVTDPKPGEHLNYNLPWDSTLGRYALLIFNDKMGSIEGGKTVTGNGTASASVLPEEQPVIQPPETTEAPAPDAATEPTSRPEPEETIDLGEATVPEQAAGPEQETEPESESETFDGGEDR